jgi:hypothetical protein
MKIPTDSNTDELQRYFIGELTGKTRKFVRIVKVTEIIIGRNKHE